MNTNTTAMKTVADLISHIQTECSPVDREARYREALDSEGDITVAGLTFSPSRIVEELDPIAFDCGCNDYADAEGWVEVGDEYYEADAVEAAREEFLDEMRSELSDMEIEQCDLESEDAEERDTDRLSSLMADIPALEARIEELERYTF